MKTVSIVGDRRQSIKAVFVSKEITLDVLRGITNTNPIPVEGGFFEPGRPGEFGFRYPSL